MQHVMTLRKTILIFGIALVVFGCDPNKTQLHNANEEILTAQYLYSASGELSAKTEFEHDSKGRLTKRNEYDADGELSTYVEFRVRFQRKPGEGEGL